MHIEVGLIRMDMLSNITWTEFFTGVGALTGLYYLYVLVKFYPEKLKTLLSAKKETTVHQPVFLQDDLSEQDEPDFEGSSRQGHDEMDEVEELIASLVKEIQTASEKNMPVDEFKKYLGMVLKEKPSLSHSPYRPSINELVLSECGKHGTFTLGEKEIDVLWE